MKVRCKMFCMFFCERSTSDIIEQQEMERYKQIRIEKYAALSELESMGDGFTYMLDISNPFGYIFRIENKETGKVIEVKKEFALEFWQEVRGAISEISAKNNLELSM